MISGMTGVTISVMSLLRISLYNLCCLPKSSGCILNHVIFFSFVCYTVLKMFPFVWKIVLVFQNWWVESGSGARCTSDSIPCFFFFFPHAETLTSSVLILLACLSLLIDTQGSLVRCTLFFHRVSRDPIVNKWWRRINVYQDHIVIVCQLVNIPRMYFPSYFFPFLSCHIGQ